MGRDKFLTEAMGECWHEYQAGRCHGQWECKHCKQSKKNINFSTWDGLGKLMIFIDGEFSDQKVAELLYSVAKDGCVTNLPNHMANAVYQIGGFHMICKHCERYKGTFTTCPHCGGEHATI